jgi:hypothetical protein
MIQIKAELWIIKNSQSDFLVKKQAAVAHQPREALVATQKTSLRD